MSKYENSSFSCGCIQKCKAGCNQRWHDPTYLIVLIFPFCKFLIDLLCSLRFKLLLGHLLGVFCALVLVEHALDGLLPFGFPIAVIFLGLFSSHGNEIVIEAYADNRHIILVVLIMKHVQLEIVAQLSEETFVTRCESGRNVDMGIGGQMLEIADDEITNEMEQSPLFLCERCNGRSSVLCRTSVHTILRPTERRASLALDLCGLTLLSTQEALVRNVVLELLALMNGQLVQDELQSFNIELAILV